MTCPQCAAQIPDNLLVCPSCRALTHAAELKTVAASAETETAAGNYSQALVHWRRALELLPRNSAQYGVINVKINDLVQRLDKSNDVPAPKKGSWASKGGIFGIFAVLLSLLSKGKTLLLGLTKMSTIFSMLLSIGVYWGLWGWKLAVGLVLSIYVHEMGHIYQLHRYGIRATAPMFIPGLGAVIRQKQYPASPHEDASVGLAGPIWGLAAAGVCYAIHLLTNLEYFAAIAQLGAWINLFNLLPFWQLDGGRGFRGLSKLERAGIAGLMGIMWVVTQEGLLLILLIVAAFRCFEKDAPQKRDLPIFAEFAFLVLTLSLLTEIPVSAERREPQIAAISAETRTFAGVAQWSHLRLHNWTQTSPPRR